MTDLVCMHIRSVYLPIILIKLKGVHLQRSRLLLCLIMARFPNQMIIIELKMLRK